MALSRALGARIRRREDPRLITGTATYVDDIVLPGMLHVVLVRSPHAHARIAALDLSAARRAPGVVAVWTGDDIRARCGPLPVGPRIREMKVPRRYPLVVDGVVRHVGDPVAAVVATTPALARDAADLVEVRYDPLPPVVDVEQAAAPGAPVIHPELGTNVCYRMTFGEPVDDALGGADVVVSLRIVQQ
ncbi:MAG: xanthine dehydrogenase family protein molybdopterin-binding subunit, partial [Armatimonadota bacterium]|nr:xanthine dehydrogenase family protein molybdopterin-binding subunit [Armatimonadota bacterium]